MLFKQTPPALKEEEVAEHVYIRVAFGSIVACLNTSIFKVTSISEYVKRVKLLLLGYGHNACLGIGQDVILLQDLYERIIFALGWKRPWENNILLPVAFNTTSGNIVIKFHSIRCFHDSIIT